jgi:hypothetical protein
MKQIDVIDSQYLNEVRVNCISADREKIIPVTLYAHEAKELAIALMKAVKESKSKPYHIYPYMGF